LPERTTLERVVLQVASLARSVAYYEQVLGMRRVGGGTHALMAAQGDDRVLVELRERTGVAPVPRRGRTGLFHFAILLPDRASLGRFVRHLGEIGAQAGAGDHLVSEAFYLTDPDGLGIEVYADRPRETWRRRGRELMMATDPVDVTGLVAFAGSEPWRGMPAGTVMGHVHLHVADIARASAFYSDALGFDRMGWSYPGALFLAAGGYHHHLGTNVWAGSGARPPGPDEAQLLEWTIVVPTTAEVSAVADRLGAAGAAVERAAGGDAVLVRDPWGTPVRIRTAG
jgi:catechol 2,3-dioxygenase